MYNVTGYQLMGTSYTSSLYLPFQFHVLSVVLLYYNNIAML